MTSTAYHSVIMVVEVGHRYSTARIKEVTDLAVTNLGYTGLRGLISKPKEAFVEGNDVFLLGWLHNS